MRRSTLAGSSAAAVVMSVASSIAIAAPVHAASLASAGHAAYLHTLEQFGLKLSHDEAFAQGVAVCLVMNEPGATRADVVKQVNGMHPTWNLADAQHFVGAAEKRYCNVCSPEV